MIGAAMPAPRVRFFACAIFLMGLSACDARVREAKELVADQLLDPESAEFRNVKAEGPRVCGQVNAKNRMGGYVGYEDFLVGERGVILESSVSNYLLATDRGQSGAEGLVGHAGRFKAIEQVTGQKADLDPSISPRGYAGMLVYCEFLKANASCSGTPVAEPLANACAFLAERLPPEIGFSAPSL
ncbi:hypothetical protein RSD66_04185 [Brevundimonas sp. S1H14]|uniref:hypothetical protein n=1 Tax=Brevundimonas sp. S1H14 TaxID=3078084 RepID=UPI0039E7F1FB